MFPPSSAISGPGLLGKWRQWRLKGGKTGFSGVIFPWFNRRLTMLWSFRLYCKIMIKPWLNLCIYVFMGYRKYCKNMQKYDCSWWNHHFLWYWIIGTSWFWETPICFKKNWDGTECTGEVISAGEKHILTLGALRIESRCFGCQMGWLPFVHPQLQRDQVTSRIRCSPGASNHPRVGHPS